MAEAVAIAIEALLYEGAIVFTAAEVAAIGATLQVALAVTSYAVSANEGRRRERNARNSYNEGLKDRELMIRSGVAPARVVYGREKISGPIVYHESTGDKKQFLHLVVALAAHECDAIETIYFNEVALPAVGGDGFVAAGEFARAEYPQALENLAADGAGVITLSRPAHQVLTATVGVGVDATTIGFTHVPESASVSGFSPGQVVTVDYTYTRTIKAVRIRQRLGAPGQAAYSELVAESAGNWTSAHVGAGITDLYIRIEYDVEIFGQVGLPNISAVLRGKKLADPRTGLTAWSENSALIAADRLRDATYGLGAQAPEVPTDELIAAANLCDEAVALDALGATQPRYTYSGSFTTDAAPLESLRAIAGSMAGSIVWAQGRWLIRPGAYRAPSDTWTEDSLGGAAPTHTPKAPRANLFNAVRAVYRDPTQAWAEVQAPLVSNAYYQAQDGGRQRVQTLQLPMACDAMRAQRLAKIELERARQAYTVQLTTNLRGYNQAPTDTINLQLARYGWAGGKVFEVLERTWAGGLEVQYTLRETAAGVFAWNYGEATTHDLAPDTALPTPYATPAAPTGLAVASGTAHLLLQGDGTQVSRAYITWTQSAEAFVTGGGQVVVQWAKVGTQDWQPTESVQGADVAVYASPVPDAWLINVRAKFVNAVGRSSHWAYTTHRVVGKTALPADVSGLAAVGGQRSATISWLASPDIDYSQTVLRVGSTWATATALALVSGTSYTWAAAPGLYTILAKHRDTSENDSSNALSCSVLVSEYTGSLIDGAQWIPGTSGAQGAYPRRFNATGSGGENEIILATGPDGQLQPLWRCISGDTPYGVGTDADGGWDTDLLPISDLKMYRFEQWFWCTGAMDGQAYLGPGSSSVRDIGGSVNSNPYFAVVPRGTLTAGRWYLMVGYVLPSTYAGAQLNQGGFWDGVTGQKIGNGTDYQWVASQATTFQRSYQYYASVGAEQWFAPPAVRLLDGSEPSVSSILATAALGRAAAAVLAAANAQATADAATTRIGAMESDGVLTPVEKPQLVQDYGVITSEQSGLDAQATAYGITTEKTAYDGAVTALTSHLATLLAPVAWNNLGGDTNITGSALRTKFGDVYATKQALMNAIAAVAGTQANWTQLANKPADTDLLNTHTQGGVLVVDHPAGGNAGFSGGATTGAIKIKLPQSWTNTMMRFYVEIYEYDADKSLTLEVGGYNYSGSGGAWYNVYAKMTGSSASEKAVRFGHDGATCCIWIGEPGSVWQYPQVVVSNLRGGYSNNTAALWASGWAVSVDNTAHSGHAITGTIANPLTGANLTTSGGSVGTVQIAANASTEVYVNTPGSAVTVTGLMHTPRGFNSGWTTELASVTFTPGASGTANVFFDGSGELTAPSGGGVEWSIQDQGGAWDGWKAVSASPPGTAQFKFSMGTTRKFAVTGGVPYTIAAYASKLDAGDTFQVRNHELRVEVIKR